MIVIMTDCKRSVNKCNHPLKDRLFFSHGTPTHESVEMNPRQIRRGCRVTGKEQCSALVNTKMNFWVQ
jgi:hypothetical protein